jgi:glycosyltransferase involved in cell wall biosynthesis
VVTRVLVVANEPIRPTTNGGRVRMAALVDALTARFDVDVLEPTQERRTFRQTFRLAPRRGTTVVDRDVVARAAGPADVVVYTHSYLEPVGPRMAQPVVVDFQNLEVERQRSLASDGAPSRRASAVAEALKARVWEPRVARRAAVVSAVTDSDAEVLRSWGARRVVVVPNASIPTSPTPSPADGPVVYVANAHYPPNVAAGRRLLEEVWPRVRRELPSARLLIAGRGTDAVFAPGDGIDVLGEVDDVADVLALASVVVAPVDEGGGTQLKVVEALAHGRVVVATTYSAASAPPGTEMGCIPTTDARAMALAIAAELRDVDRRHERERAMRDAVPTWERVAAPFVDAVGELGSR